jgi:hypothetical protein
MRLWSASSIPECIEYRVLSKSKRIYRIMAYPSKFRPCMNTQNRHPAHSRRLETANGFSAGPKKIPATAASRDSLIPLETLNSKLAFYEGGNDSLRQRAGDAAGVPSCPVWRIFGVNSAS